MATLDFESLPNASQAKGLDFGTVADAPQQGPPMPDADTLRQLRLRAIARAAMPGDMGAGDIYKDRFTLGLQGPTAGLANAVGGSIKGLFGAGDDSTFGERYAAGEQAYDEKLRQAEADTGGLGTAASVAGMLTPGGAGRNALVAAPNVLKTAAQSGFLGGVSAAGNARGTAEERAVKTAEGAVTGAAVGAATDKLLGMLPWSARRAARTVDRQAARGPAPDDIRQQGRDLFQILDNSGTAYSTTQAQNLTRQAATDLRQAGYDRAINARANAIVDDLTGHQGPMTLEQLQNLRSRTAELARGNDANDRRIAGVILRSIDNHVGTVDPALTQLPPGQVGPIYQQARDYWRTASLADDLGWMVDKAERRAASTNSGQNAENAIRQNLRQVEDRVTKPGAYNPYSDEQMQLMDQAVRGTRTQNVLRGTGNFLRSIPGASASGGAAMSGMIHGLTTGNPTIAIASGALPLASYGASKALSAASRNMAEDAADRLIGNVARGGAPALTSAQRAIMQGPPTRQRLALMQALGITGRLSSNIGGAVGGSVVQGF